ncbi:hypothetical protein [Pararhizobium sp. IMCC21322]|uniref:hypothetical protein n=1 Tax=Pararhizobium sp. IMCC21322 TaxID=3067903 RepID=UPI002741FCED|nr:hypothetical protein [Pararhizobium sp. IMCC21322]
MTDALFAIFMVSCSHMLGICRENTEPVEVLQSEQECVQTLYGRLNVASIKYEDRFPVAIGKCVAMDSTMALDEPAFDWFFQLDGKLSVKIIPPVEVQNAANTVSMVVDGDEG